MWRHRRTSEPVLKPCLPPQIPPHVSSTSALRPRLPGGCQSARDESRYQPVRFTLLRPSVLRDRSVVSPLNAVYNQPEMYKNEAFYQDYGSKDAAYRDPCSINNSQSTPESSDRRPPGPEHVPSYYYKDYVPLNAVPQTPASPADTVFTTTPVPTNTVRMNGYLKTMKPSTSSKSESPDSRTSKDSGRPLGNSIPLTVPVLNIYGVHSNTAAIGLTSVLSLMMGIIGLQLLLTMGERRLSTVHNDTLVSPAIYEALYQATVTLSSVVLALNLTCTLICTMQCFFVTRLLKLHRGYRRAFKYLKECSAVRLISVTGFFLSIPTFLAALILYCVMELRSTGAIICTLVIGLGIILCVAAYVESIVHLSRENTMDNTDSDMDKEMDRKNNPVYGISQNELSTLV